MSCGQFEINSVGLARFAVFGFAAIPFPFVVIFRIFRFEKSMQPCRTQLSRKNVGQRFQWMESLACYTFCVRKWIELFQPSEVEAGQTL